MNPRGRYAVSVLLAGLFALAGASPTMGFRQHLAVRESLAGVHPRFREFWLKEHGHDVGDFLPSPRPVSDSAGLYLLGKWGRGPSVDVTGSDTLVALTLGSEVALINFADPDQPRILSEIQLDFMPSKSALAGSLLIVGGRGMDIWNVADPAHPARISRFPIGAGDFCVKDSLVCFIQTDTFRVYSISDPANPRPLGAYRDSGYVFTVSGNTVVAGHPSVGLFFVDISNPTQPSRVGTYASDRPLAAQARGNLCCASFQSRVDPYPIRFVTLDIGDPTSVRQLARIDSAGGYDIYLWDTLAFASGRDRAYAEEFQIISIADSAHPRMLGRGKTPYDNWGVWACPPRSRAYVADRGKGMSAFDITDLTNPVRDTGIMVADLAYDVAVDGNRAYVADYVGGLRVLDVSDPAVPTELGGMDAAEATCWTVAAKDSFAFVGWRPSPYFRSILVSDPTRPQHVGSGPVQTVPEDMVLRDTLLYLVGRLRFNVVNVARPRSPELIGSCVVGDATNAGMYLRDTLAYVCTWPFNIVNVADPKNPYVAGSLWHGAANVYVVDSLAYLANGGLFVYNVKNPAMPVPVDSLVAGIYAHDIVVVDTLAYVGCLDAAMRIISVADPHNMRIVSSSRTPWWVWRIAFAPPHLYAACFDGGLCVFETTTTGVREDFRTRAPTTDARILGSVTNGVATIELQDATGRGAHIQVFDVAGNRIAKTDAPAPNRGITLRHRIDLASMAAGVYVVRVSTSNRVHHLRITKLQPRR